MSNKPAYQVYIVKIAVRKCFTFLGGSLALNGPVCLLIICFFIVVLYIQTFGSQ